LPAKHPASKAKNRAEVTAKIRRAISSSEHHFILSSEFFATLPYQGLGEMVASLYDLGEVQLVFFVREQVNLLSAGYIQGVKRSMQTQFPDEYFSSLDLSKRPHLAYNTYFTNLAAAAPDATILVKPYELSKNHDAGLMGLFLEMINAEIPVEDLPANSFVNLSPSPQEVRLMIELNKYQPRNRFSDMLVEASQLADRSNIFTEHGIIPPKEMARIRDFYKAENAGFFANFAKSDNIYEEHSNLTEFLDLREITFDAQDVMDILLGILVKMDHRLAALEV
jgi:hypothetical protein